MTLYNNDDVEGFIKEEEDINKWLRGKKNTGLTVSLEDLKTQFPEADEAELSKVLEQQQAEQPEKPTQPFYQTYEEAVKQASVFSADYYKQLQINPAVAQTVPQTTVVTEPTTPVTTPFVRDRETANLITDLEQARKYAAENKLPMPNTWEEWVDTKNYIPPYQFTPEQKAILSGAIPITEWNSNAALWAGVPADIIAACINAGGVNVKVVGWGPTDGYLRQFYDNITANLASSERLKIMGITPGMFGTLLKNDYQSRLDSGLISEGGGRKLRDLESAVIEENGVKYRMSGKWAFNEQTGEYDFIPDGRIKVKALPVELTDIEAEAEALMKPISDYTYTKPALPDGYSYGQLQNTVIEPDGALFIAKDDDEFTQYLMDLGVIPKVEFQRPYFEYQFRSFNELKIMEQHNESQDILKELTSMYEADILDQQDIKDYTAGKITLDKLNEKTGGLYANPLHEMAKTPENLEAIVTEVEADPDGFWRILQREGRTEKTEDLLYWLGATEDDIEVVYPGSKPVPRTVSEIRENYDAINLEELAERILVIDAMGDKEPISKIGQEILNSIPSTDDFTEHQKTELLTAFNEGKVTNKQFVEVISRELYIALLNEIYATGKDDNWRYEVASEAQKQKVIDYLTKLNVPEHYIRAVEEGVINPRYLVTATRPLLEYTQAEYIQNYEKSWAVGLTEMYLWIKMGEAERKGFWGFQTETSAARWLRYEMWDAPPAVKEVLEVISNPIYLVNPFEGEAVPAIKFFWQYLTKWISERVAKGAEQVGAKAIAAGAERVAERGPAVITRAQEIIKKPITYPLKKGTDIVKKTVKKPAGVVTGAPERQARLPHFTESTDDFVNYITEKYPGRVKGDYIESTFKKAKLVTVRADEAGAVAETRIREAQDLIGNIERMLGADKETQIIKDTSRLRLKPDAPDAIKQKLAGNQLTSGDVMEFYKYFNFDDPNIPRWIESANKFIDEVYYIMMENGVDVPRLTFNDLNEYMRIYYPRYVKGVTGLTEEELPAVGGANARRLVGKMSNEKQRLYDMMTEGVDKSVKYAGPLDSLLHYARGGYKRIGNKQATDVVEQFFKAAPLETGIGRYAKWLAGTAVEQKNKAQRLLDVIKRIKRGERPAGATLNALKRDFPGFETWINDAVSLNVTDIPKLIKSLSNKFFAEYKITREEFARAFEDMMKSQMRSGRARGNRLRLSDIEYVLDRFNKGNEFKRRTISKFADYLSGQRKNILRGMQDEAERILGISKVVAGGAKAQKATIMERLRRVGLTEAFSMENARIFEDVVIDGKRYTGKYIEQQFKKTFGEDVNAVLKALSATSRAFVTAEASTDFSAMFIQGFLLLGKDLSNLLSGKPTALFGKATYNMFASFFNKNVYRNILEEMNGIIVRYGQHGLITGVSGTEFTQILPAALQKAGEVPVIGKGFKFVIEQTFGRFGYSFSVFGDTARLYGIRSMEDAWLKAGRNPRELANLWNLMTGVVSTRAMNVSANQRAIESAGLFASRYLRSNLIVLGNLFSRGATANEFRKVVISSLVAWGSLYTGFCFMLGEEPKLNPLPKEYGGNGSEFMTVNIGGQVFGLPGFAKLLRLVSTLACYLVTEPDRYIKLDYDKANLLDEVKQDPFMQNFIKAIFQKAAPPVNLVKEMVTGRDFLGRKFEDAGDYLMDILEKFIPIAAQSWISKDKPSNPWAYGAEMLGLQTYPQGKWATYNEAFNIVIEDYIERPNFLSDEQIKKFEEGKLTWFDLGDHVQWVVMQENPDLQPLLDEAKTESERYDTNEMIWYRNQRQTIYDQRLTQDKLDLDLIRNLEKKDYTIRDLRWSISENKSNSYIASQSLKNDPKYTDVLSPYFDRVNKLTKDSGNLDIFDIAVEEWFDFVLADDDAIYDKMTDEEKYTERQRRIDAFKVKYGDAIYQYIEEITMDNLKDEDPLLTKLHVDKLTLNNEYWRILNELGDADRTGRLEYRKDPNNWQVDAMLNFWGYTSTIVNEDVDKVEQQIKDWCKQYNIPEEKIPLFMAESVPEIATLKYDVSQVVWDEYNAIDDRYTRTDERNYYKWQYLLSHPELNAYFVTEEGRTDARLRSLNIPESEDWLTQYNIYDKIRKSTGKADVTKRRQYRLDNPEFDIAGETYGYWKVLPENAVKMPAPAKAKTVPSNYPFGKLE